ncbi:MAG: FG-GAP repeat domain-containing protein [Planctomycetota bacterium]|jgi:hypothetical protein
MSGLRQIARIALAAGFAATVAASVASPARAVGFTEYVFGEGERIVDHAVLDLDGDQRNDFILVRGRKVQIHLQTAQGGFDPSNPDQVFNFVDKAILWTFADVTGDDRPEILFLAGDGVYYYSWRRKRLGFTPRTLFKTTSILDTASRDEVRLKDFFIDVDGDGERDLLLPTERGFALHRGLGKKKFSPADLLSMRPDVNVSLGWNRPTDDARSTFWYAEPKVGDWNGDGKSDVVIYQRRQIVVFLQRAGGRFGPAPTLTMPLEFTGALEEGRFKLDLELPTEVDDIDGDGTVEIIASHVGRATTQVYRGGPERKDLGRPDALIKLEGITFVQFVTDLDGDGRSDLILARTDKPGLLGILTVLITKEVEVELLFFFGRGGGEVLPRVPDERRAIEIPILFSSARRGLNVGTSAVLSVLGDFDGDGQNDLILRTGEDKIGLFPGQGRKFAEDELVTLTVQPMDGYRFLEPTPVSLNGDKVADLVLTYYSWDGKGDRMSLLVSSEE